MEYWNLLYWIIILEYWETGRLKANWVSYGTYRGKKRGQNGEDKHIPKSQRGVNMDQEEKKLDCSIIGSEMRRPRGMEWEK